MRAIERILLRVEICRGGRERMRLDGTFNAIIRIIVIEGVAP